MGKFLVMVDAERVLQYPDIGKEGDDGALLVAETPIPKDPCANLVFDDGTYRQVIFENEAWAKIERFKGNSWKDCIEAVVALVTESGKVVTESSGYTAPELRQFPEVPLEDTDRGYERFRVTTEGGFQWAQSVQPAEAINNARRAKHRKPDNRDFLIAEIDQRPVAEAKVDEVPARSYMPVDNETSIRQMIEAGIPRDEIIVALQNDDQVSQLDVIGKLEQVEINMKNNTGGQSNVGT